MIGGKLINQVHVRDEVYQILRRGIITRQFAPGLRLNLEELEEEFGVSRTPIKEALQRLEAEGLVEIKPRRGTYVVSIDRRDIEETWEIRRVLERYAAEVVAEKVAEEELERLRGLVEAMEQLPLENLPPIIEKLIGLDHDFHVLLVSFAHNRRLTEMYDGVGHFCQLIRCQLVFEPDDLQRARLEHRRIFDALQARDSKRLVRSLDDHMRLSEERLFARYKGA